MTPAASTYFKHLCHSLEITCFASKLHPHLLRLEEIDFWVLLHAKADMLRAPLKLFEMGGGLVLHFYVLEEEQDIYVELSPKNPSAFRALLEDYQRNATH